jgi:hypothetical protein
MPTSNRLAWGHTLTDIGVVVRRVSMPLAAVAAVALAFILAPSSFEPAWIAVLAVAVFAASRVIAVGLAALGWMVFPPDHRTVLAELSTYATTDG